MGNDWREFCLVPSAKGGVDVKVLRGVGEELYPLWVPANLMLGVTLRWTSIPSRDNINVHVAHLG